MFESILANDLDVALRGGEKKTILDVRELDEVLSGKIPGALHIPVHEISARMNELDKHTEYTVICYSGGRSSAACEFLSKNGYKVVNVLGGMSAWRGDIE